MPVIQSIAQEKAGLIKIVTINTSSNPNIAMRYQIQGVPAFYLFDRGKILNHLAGALPRNQFEQWIEQSFQSHF